MRARRLAYERQRAGVFRYSRYIHFCDADAEPLNGPEFGWREIKPQIGLFLGVGQVLEGIQIDQNKLRSLRVAARVVPPNLKNQEKEKDARDQTKNN